MNKECLRSFFIQFSHNTFTTVLNFDTGIYMLKLNKKVIKNLAGREFPEAVTKDIAGGHDFPPSCFRGCVSNETIAEIMK